jgi:hypothetical protein
MDAPRDGQTLNCPPPQLPRHIRYNNAQDGSALRNRKNGQARTISLSQIKIKTLSLQKNEGT